MLDWLNTVMTAFGNLFPRLLIIKSTHAGVRFRNGSRPSAVTPGIRIFWPLVTIIDILPVVRQTMELTRQTLTTRDHVSIAIGTIVIYTIDDIVAALTTTDDLNDTIYDVAKGAVLEVVGDMDYSTLVSESKTVNHEIAKKVRHNLKTFGVAVQNAYIINFTRTLSITLEQ